MHSTTVGVNLLYLRPGHVGGSEIYVRSLLRELAPIDGLHLVLFATAEAAASLADLALPCVTVGGPGFSQARRLVDENLTLAPLVRRHRLDVLFSPANFGAPLLPSRVPQVVTVHDLQHQWLPELFSRAKRVQRTAMFHASFQRASHIIAISDFTRRDVLSRYPVSEDRITTILEGFDAAAVPSEAATMACRERYDLAPPYLYYPATDNAHKNHELLIDLLAEPEAAGVSLVLTGSRSTRWPSLEARAHARGVADRIHHLGFVPRPDVYALMAGAAALAFPSRFEGFGLPVLEAQQCNTPVLASRAASIPEVAGDGALLLPPDEPRAWANALRQILDGNGNDALLARGHANLARFSWRRCADQTAAILRTASAHRRR